VSVSNEPSRPEDLVALLLRFAAGTAGSIGFGFLTFGSSVFDPGNPRFQCLTVGPLGASMLALVRGSRHRAALAVGAAFGLLQVGLSWGLGSPRALTGPLWSLFLCGGLFIIAVIFDLLAEAGHRLGKFLVLGLLLSGVYLAGTPLMGLGQGVGDGGIFPFLFNAFLGIVIGDGVGVCVELVELLPFARSRPEP